MIEGISMFIAIVAALFAYKGARKQKPNMDSESFDRALYEHMKREEGVRQNAYLDTQGHWTIGIGHKILPTESWMIGQSISMEKVQELFEHDINWAKAAVIDNVDFKLNDNQKIALISLTYNIGSSAFRTSTLRRKLNQLGPVKEAAQHILDWSKNKELLPRRHRELKLFFA